MPTARVFRPPCRDGKKGVRNRLFEFWSSLWADGDFQAQFLRGGSGPDGKKGVRNRFLEFVAFLGGEW
jgi:hypothetical protein